MSKITKWILISSLSLNGILIIGFILFRASMEKTILKIGTLNAVANATERRHILNELELNDPNRVEGLKIYLRNGIEISNVEADEYRKASKK